MPVWLQMRAYAVIAVFLYPIGVPSMIFLLLWRIRDQLNPTRSFGTDELSIIEKLEQSDLYKIEPIAQFSRHLRPQFW